jgi:hypothetical protein
VRSTGIIIAGIIIGFIVLVILANVLINQGG